MTNEIKAACAGAFITGAISLFCWHGSIENNNANWIKAIAEISEEVDETMSREKALKILSEEIKKKDQIIDELGEKLSETQEKNEKYSDEDTIRGIISQVTHYWNNNDYIQALMLLKESEQLAPDISLLYTQYSSEYCGLIIKQANELISQKKADEAKSLIISNVGIVKDQSSFSKKLEEIENNKPIKLSSIKPTASRYYNQISDAGVNDTVGNYYSSGNGFILKAEGSEGYGYGTFYLGGNYNSMSICAAVSDKSENRADNNLSGWLGIYRKNGEDYILLKRIDNITRIMSPVEINDLDLSDAEWLEIRYYNDGTYFSLAGGYHSLEIIVANGMLYK